jgi:hypothetical protein
MAFTLTNKVVGSPQFATSLESQLNTLLGAMSAAELGFLDGVTAGTSASSKAVVLSADGKIDTIDMTAFKVGGTSVSATAAELNYCDVTTLGQVEASKAVTADSSSKISLAKIGTGSPAASASGLLFGVGTSANPVNTASAGNFTEIRAKGTATSGDTRLDYRRLELAGAGGSGEALRAFTDLTAAATTARGTQISLQAGATGYITGLGVGVDAQLYIKNEALHANGTYAAINAEIYSAGATSSVAAATSVAFLRFANSGNATGAGTVDAKAYLFDLTGFSSGSANLWYDHQGSAPVNIEEWLKVKTPAGDRWLPLYNAVV